MKTEHKMHLTEKPFGQICATTKTIEVRLNDAKRQSIAVGDRIEFTLKSDSTKQAVVEVVNIYHADKFEDLYKLFDPTKAGVIELRGWKSIYKYYTETQENEYGAIGIEFNLLWHSDMLYLHAKRGLMDYNKLAKKIITESMWMVDLDLEGHPRKEDIPKHKRILHQRYFNQISKLSNMLTRLSRYEVYFAEFYPIDFNSITRGEALEYHIHAYIQDMGILRNSLKTLLETARNDLKKIKDEIPNYDEALLMLEEGLKLVETSMKDVTDNRNPHVHNGRLFGDYKITAAKSLEGMTELEDNFSAHGIEMLKNKATEHADNARKEWIDKSKRNYKSIEKLVNHIAMFLDPVISRVLDID